MITSGYPVKNRLEFVGMLWFGPASAIVDGDAQYNLGFMYYNGEGVLEDYVQAYAWWNIAATQDDEMAREFKSELAEKMTPSQIAEAQMLSKELREKIQRQ